jgi:hypothetical protein
LSATLIGGRPVRVRRALQSHFAAMNVQCQANSVPEATGKDLTPAVTGYQAGYGCQPEPVRRPVADRAGDLTTHDHILMPEHKHLGGIHGVTA